MKQIDQVREFHEAFGIPIKPKPEIPSTDRIDLRHNILIEEVEELRNAMLRGDLVETADGIIDCLYVIIGTAHECGMQDYIIQMFDEVHRSNMTKLDDNGKPIYREDGKVMKSKRFTRPDLKTILNQDRCL